MPTVIAAAPTVTVERIVQVPCVAKKDIPAPPELTMLKPEVASVQQLAAAVGADILNLRNYAAKLRAMLLACTLKQE